MPDQEFTAEQVDAAVELLSDPERLKHAQQVVTHAAPALQRILNEALDEGGYLTASGAAVAQAAGSEPLEDRILAVRTLLAEETRLGMLVGATVGFELARILTNGPIDTTPTPTPRSPEATMQIRFLGHAAFELTHDGVTVLIDPFITGNPKATVSADELNADAILLTHGHQDHFGDTVEIAKRTGATVQAITEIAGEIGEEGVETIDTNMGGTAIYGWGSVRLTQAFHTSTTPKGTVTPPGGLVIEMGGKVIYDLGDTALFSDLALPGQRKKVDIALIPIGGHYTMDREDAVVAAKLVGAEVVIPKHYDTFPPIETDVQAYKSEVEAAGYARVEILAPGESYDAG